MGITDIFILANPYLALIRCRSILCNCMNKQVQYVNILLVPLNLMAILTKICTLELAITKEAQRRICEIWLLTSGFSFTEKKLKNFTQKPSAAT